MTVMYGEAETTIALAVGTRLYSWNQNTIMATFWRRKNTAKRIKPSVKGDRIFLKLDEYSDTRTRIKTVFASAKTAATYNQTSAII